MTSCLAIALALTLVTAPPTSTPDQLELGQALVRCDGAIERCAGALKATRLDRDLLRVQLARANEDRVKLASDVDTIAIERDEAREDGASRVALVWVVVGVGAAILVGTAAGYTVGRFTP